MEERFKDWIIDDHNQIKILRVLRDYEPKKYHIFEVLTI